MSAYSRAFHPSPNIDLGKPKSGAPVVYLDVVNNYTVIQHVKQILDDQLYSFGSFGPKLHGIRVGLHCNVSKRVFLY